MRTEYCECNKEQAVAAGLRNGLLPEELLDHIGVCPACSEVLCVAQALREDAAAVEERLQLPDPGLVWRRAREQAKARAIARATLPIRVVRICACVVAILSAPWLVSVLLRLPSWMPALDRKWFLIDSTWRSFLTQTTLLGMIGTLLCIGLSSWYMLREE